MAIILFSFITINILILFGILFYYFLYKSPKIGDTFIQFKIALCKILKIEFKFKHDDHSKK